MTLIVAVIRLLLLLLLLAVGFIAGIFSFAITANFYQKIAAVWHRCVVWVCGIRCEYSGVPVESGVLIASNHISWLDISILGAATGAVFLAKDEIRNWPVMGYMIARAGTLFIDRGRGANQAIKLISAALRSGQSVVIFPEGKTTDGMGLAKFHPRLFQGAIDARANVQTIALTYLDSKNAITSAISYTGNSTFLGSIWNTVKSNGIVVKVHVFSTFSLNQSRDELAKKVVILIKNHRKSIIKGLILPNSNHCSKKAH